MSQLGLFQNSTSAVATGKPAKARRPSIEMTFTLFHVANPRVFAELLRLARARLDRGERRIGVKALWEELRQYLVVNKLDDQYKLNNSFTALYARMLIDADPRFEEVIELRRRKAK